ncbi:MAG: TonB-dependent receptor plug domain-containing protein [Alistipes sp.]
MKKQPIKGKPIPCFKRWLRKNYAVFASLHRQVTIGVLAIGMSILVLAAEEAAAQTDTVFVFGNTRIDEVEVVGTKQSPSRSILPQTSVFNRSVEAAAPLSTLEEALRVSPTIDVRERSGKGTQADISIRGGSADQTMVMLNGINFTDARTGHQSHALPIDLDCISGIELVEGISGVGAYSGAVNIRTQPLYPTYLRLMLESGQHGYFYANLSGAVTRNRFSLFAAGSFRRSDGYTYNTDFRNANGYLRMTYDAKKAGFFDFQAGVQGRRFGSNGFYAAYNREQFEQTSTALGSLRWVKDFGRVRLNADVSYRKNFDRYEWYRGTPTNYHNTDNAGAELWGDVHWCAGVTSIGGDYMYHHIFSSNLGEMMSSPRGYYKREQSRHVGNAWLRHVKHWVHFEIAGSAGISFTPYGNSALWALTGAYRTGAWRVDAGAEQSMRLPTFTDLYYTSAAQINNLDLVPERAITYHIGTSYTHGKWHAKAQLFYRDGRNVIDWVWREQIEIDGEMFYNKWHSEQQSRLGTFGAEVSGGYQADKGVLRRATLSYCYMDTSKLKKDVTTSSVLDYMRHKLSASVEIRPVDELSVALTGTLYDRNGAYTDYLRDATGNLIYDEAGRMQTALRDFKPYFLLDARIRYEIGTVAVHIDLSNITDTRYCDFGGLRRPGFWLTGGVTFTIK